MLHKINLPRSWRKLSWILAFQHRLLVKLCDPEITSEEVTVQWVKDSFSKLPSEWVESFCSRSFKEKKLLARMKIIANFDAASKKQLLSDFEEDANYRQAFQNEQSQFHFQSLQKIDGAQKEDVRYFFESFYSAQFYFDSGNRRSGYYIPHRNGNCSRYHHTQFVQDFNDHQTIRVCAFCDGALSGVQVDHFYSKEHHPFLSCHPFNLVPICGECNKVKLRQQAMDNLAEGQNALANWPHPYLRSLADYFTIEFIRDDEPLRPEIHGDDDNTNTRLGNLDTLIGLKPRWQKALEHRVSHTKESIDGYRRYLQRRRQTDGNLSKGALLEELDKWAWTLPVGTEPFGLLGKAYLEQAAADNPDIIEELHIASMQPLPSLA